MRDENYKQVQTNQPKPRTLKIRPFHRCDTRERLRKSTPTYPTTVPEIRLCGNRLADFGFELGRNVMVIFEKGKLTIEMI